MDAVLQKIEGILAFCIIGAVVCGILFVIGWLGQTADQMRAETYAEAFERHRRASRRRRRKSRD